MSETRLMSLPDLLCLLEERIKLHGSGRQWALAHNLSEAYLSDVRTGRRLPGGKILKAVGVARVEAYRMLPQTEDPQ